MKLENYSKGLFLFCGLILIVVGVPRLFLNSWIPYSEYFFFTALFLFFAAAAFSYKTILDFFSMKTTKHGMNMGSLVLLGAILYVCINFFAFRYDKSVDITGDKINSLSSQSLEILESLKEEIEFKVYFQGKAHSKQNIAVKLLFKKYLRETDLVKTKFVDAYKDPSSAMVLKREDQGKIVIFINQGERSERVREPISEESITSAIFRLEQIDAKKIYFLTGHGERSFNTSASSGTGISLLADALRAKGLSVAELNLLQSQKVPEDTAMLAVLGPKKTLLKREILTIKDYLKDGGRLLLASDPSQKSNLNVLSSFVGIGIKGNFLLATQTIAGADALSVLGQSFDKTNAVTEDLDDNAITLFYEASSLVKEKTNFDVSEMVKTPPVVIPVKSLQRYKSEIQGKKPIVVTVAMMAKGSFEDAEKKDRKEFTAAVFGDSDFLTDAYLEIGFNKDLALNTFAQLAGETSLISIRPRTAKDTKLELTTAHSAFVLMFPILMPLILLIIASILWFRRRGA